MAFDKLYSFDKKTTYISGLAKNVFLRNYVGEIQNNFNFSFVCDGTKDSCKVVIYNYDKKELDPNTICWLETTNTWWVVKSDKVKRYAQELGGWYEHTITMYGVFEILNHRDLINCGFNAKRYDVDDLLKRIIKMSDFEFDVVFEYNGYISQYDTVTYLKTFQNYTPASAIKEIFNGMNCDAKMYFTQLTYGTQTYLNDARIYPISKSGSSYAPINITTFDDDAEQSSSNIESYGTRVISNVENCVCANVVRYPSVGSIKLTSAEQTVDANNGFIRLPNNIYELVDINITRSCLVEISQIVGTESKYITLNIASMTKDIFSSYIKNSFSNYGDTSFWEEFDNKIDDIWENMSTKLRATLKNGGEYNAIQKVYSGDFLVIRSDVTTEHDAQFEIMINDSKHATTSVFNKKWCMSWEQGSDKITNFQWLTQKGKKLPNESYNTTLVYHFNLGNWQFSVDTDLNITQVVTDNYLTIDSVEFSVDYIPMADLKVKVDNEIAENDSKIFNQNGKMIDSVAISKLINSYSKEISSNEITRYKNYRKYTDIPKVSQLVNNNGEMYIINNVSIDFYENDDDKYFLECSFTMTKQVACKSTMISANTNIRDYECPQQNNIKRIQTYRDYIEFGYEVENNDTPYLSLGQVFNFNIQTKGNIDNHTCLFSSKLNDNETYYYKIGSTKYDINKQFIEYIDFKDNNIIGYEAGVSYILLTISQFVDILKTANKKSVNTPISYVDNKGEVEAFNLKLLDEKQIEQAYETNGATLLQSKFVTLPKAIWDYVNADSSRYDISIVENDYDKDGLEVPVFEYACQVGDANGIVFGADFLKGATAVEITYHYKVLSNTQITQDNAMNYMVSGGTATLNYLSNELTLGLQGNTTDIKDKTICVWCQIKGGDSGYVFLRKETNNLYSTYGQSEKTLALTHTQAGSTFNYLGYELVNTQQPSEAFARVNSYTTTTISYQMGSGSMPTAQASGKLSYYCSGAKPFSNYVGEIEDDDIEIVAYEPTIYKGKKRINWQTSVSTPTIESSGITGYENTSSTYTDPMTMRVYLDFTIYSTDRNKVKEGLYVYNYTIFGSDWNEEVEVEGSGFEGEKTYNLPTWATLKTTTAEPSITLYGEYINPIVNARIEGDNLKYIAYDSGDHSREVIFRVKYGENYIDYTDIENQFLFAVNNCKVSGTTVLKLKVNNWKLK